MDISLLNQKFECTAWNCGARVTFECLSLAKAFTSVKNIDCMFVLSAGGAHVRGKAAGIQNAYQMTCGYYSLFQ